MKVRIADVGSPLTSDIDLAASFNAVETDKTVNRCISAVTESLKTQSGHFTDVQQNHLSQIFDSMRHAHRAIRKLIESDGKDPAVVNVMSLARGQLETLFSICLLVEDPKSLNRYLKDGWKKLYVRHLLAGKEGQQLPRVVAALQKQADELEKFRVASGVTVAEKQTIDQEELGTALPPGVAQERIDEFPMPGRVLGEVRDQDRKKMLKRLYPEYQYLCGFVHFSPAAMILGTLLDTRHPLSHLSTSGQKYEIFQKEIASPALGIDLLSVVQSCCEFVLVYPQDMELVKAVADGWNQVARNWLLGKIIWQLRAKTLLGAL